MTDAASSVSFAPRKGGLLKKILLGIVGLIVLVLVVVPLAVPSVAKSRALDAVGAQINGTAELGGLSFMWPADVTLEDFALRDARGEKVVAVKRITAEAGLLGALTGSYSATVSVERPEITLREGADGRFSLETLAKAPPQAAETPKLPAPTPTPRKPSEPKPTAKKAPAPKPKAEPIAVPEVKATVRVVDGIVLVVRKDGRETRFTDVNMTVNANDGLAKTATFALSLRSAGGGDLSAKGDLVVAPDGKFTPDAVAGALTYAINRLDLGGLAPVVAKYAPVDRLAGVVDGGGTYRIAGGAVEGKGEIKIVGVDAAGAAFGAAPLRFAAITVKDDVRVAADRGVVACTFAADDAATMTARAEFGPDGDGMKAGGTLALGANFAALSRAAPGLLKLKPGYRLEGTAKVDASFEGLAGPEGLGAAFAKATAKLESLAVFDAQNRPVPIDREAVLTLDATRTAEGAAELKSADFRMGAVSVQAGGSYDAATRVIGRSFLKADANLDDLSAKLTSFMDLGATFGGTIKADVRVEGGADAARASTRVDVARLRVAGADGRTFGPLDVTVEQAAALDLREGGRTTIEKSSITSTVLKMNATGYVTDAADPTKSGGVLDVSGESDPAALQRVAGDYLAGYALAGAPLTFKARATFSPEKSDANGELRATGLAVTGPTLGAEGMRLGSFTTEFDATSSRATGDFDLRSLVVRLSDLAFAPKDAPAVARIRAVELDLAASVRGKDAELKRLALKSDLADATGSARATSVGLPGMRLEGRIDARGDVRPLVDLARAFAPDYKDARATGAWESKFEAVTKGDDVTVTSTFTASKVGVSGVKAGDKVVSAENVDVAYASETALNTAGTGTAEIRSASLTAPGLTATLGGRLSKFLGEGASPDATLKIAGSFDPAEASRRLAAFLLGYELAGSPLRFETDVLKTGRTTVAKGSLRGPAFELTMPPDPTAPPESPASGKRVVRQQDLDVAFDVTQVGTPGAESLEIRTASFASRTAKASARGRLAGAGYADADLVVAASTELADVVRDLGALMPLKDVELRGRTNVDARLKGGGAAAKIDGALKIADLVVSAPGENGGPRRSVTEPSVDAGFDADFASAAGNLVINRCDVKSGFLWGGATGRILNLNTEPEFVGLKGDFTYQPDRLGAVLRPFMTTGRLEGAETKKVVFTLDGKAKETDWVSVLRGSHGRFDAGLARFVLPAVDVLGDLNVVIKDEQVATTGTMKLNGGGLNITSALDLRRRDDAVSRVQVSLAGAKANEEMSPLLALVSPVLALDGGGGGGGRFLSGLLDLNLELTYTGRVDPDTFSAGADRIPYAKMDGKGRIGFTDLAVQGSSLIGSLAGGLFSGGLASLAQGGGLAGAPAEARRLDLEPIEFTIRKGRLAYDKPLKMAIAGMRTQWSGSIGLDRTLDMALEIPVTDQMTKKHAFLSFFGGESIKVPLAGTTAKPDLRLDQALAGLAQDAVKRQLQQGVGGGLGDLLGGKKPPLPVPSGAGDPSKPPSPKPPAPKPNDPPPQQPPTDRPKDRPFPPFPFGDRPKPAPEKPPAQPPTTPPTTPPATAGAPPASGEPATRPADAPTSQPATRPSGAPVPPPTPEKPPADPNAGKEKAPMGGLLERQAEEDLKKADALHDAGKTKEAADAYRKLRQRYGKTEVYRKNRARIDERTKG